MEEFPSLGSVSVHNVKRGPWRSMDIKPQIQPIKNQKKEDFKGKNLKQNKQFFDGVKENKDIKGEYNKRELNDKDTDKNYTEIKPDEIAPSDSFIPKEEEKIVFHSDDDSEEECVHEKTSYFSYVYPEEYEVPTKLSNFKPKYFTTKLSLPRNIHTIGIENKVEKIETDLYCMGKMNVLAHVK